MREPLYLPRKRLQRASVAQVHELFKEVLSVTYPESMALRCNILTALFYCTYLSAADLSYYLGMPEHSFKSLHKQLNSLEKAGLVKSVPLKAKDAFSKLLFYLSDSGFAMAAGYLGIEFSFSINKRGKLLTTMHDYSVGLNALQLLLFGIPFKWSKEISYSFAYRGIKQMGSLCVDAICDFPEQNLRLYLEEDLGHESVGILLGKLEKYDAFSLMDHAITEAIVYSFRQPYVTCDAPANLAYSAKNVEKARKWLLEQNKGLNEALEELTGVSGKEEELRSILEDLKTTFQRLGNIKEVSASYLEQYQKDLVELKSDLRVKDYNIRQEEFTRMRFRSMAGVLCKRYRQNIITPTGPLAAFMKGFSAYCCSTTLLMNEIPYYFYNMSAMEYTFAYTLSPIFPGIQASSYRPILEPRLEYKTGGSRILSLRNCFSFQYGKVCIEYLGRDLGAVLRTLRYIDFYKDADCGVHLVCILEQLSDFYFFEKSLLGQDLSIPTSKKGIPYLIFLDKSSLQDRPYLFTLDQNHDIKVL